MTRDNIIKKSDNTQKVFLTESTLDVARILDNHYPYIHEAMKEEGYSLKYDECNLFKELVFENMVVGFCSYDFSREFITAAINNIYVLPEFRGKNIFFDELQRTMVEHNKPSLMEPTRRIVELLIQYGFARRVSEGIVASSLEFVIPGTHVLTNGDYENEELSTHFYDLNICASIHVLDFKKAHVAYSAPLNQDIIEYDCIDERKKLDDGYFTKIIDLFKDNDVEFMNVLVELEENLPIKNYTLEEVIGEDDSFSFYIETLIDDAHVTRSRAFEIREQIREEYEAGMILNESLLIRLAYLFNDNPSPTITSHEEVCPYCSMPVDDHDKFCHFCGVNLDYDSHNAEDVLFESLNTQDSSEKEDIRFIAYKFLKMIESKIEPDYCKFSIENNYNVTYMELDSFLSDNNYLKDDTITAEGHDFLNSHPLHFWEKYDLSIVDYTDFENYFYNHPDLNPAEICLEYLKQFDGDELISDIINEIKKDLK